MRQRNSTGGDGPFVQWHASGLHKVKAQLRLAKLERAVASVLEPLEARRLLATPEVVWVFDYLHPWCSGRDVYQPGKMTVTPAYEDSPCQNCGGQQNQVAKTSADATGQNQTSKGYGPKPVRYFDGRPLVEATDLSSLGFGNEWGHTRSWSRAVGSSNNGNGWMVHELPVLVRDAGDSEYAVVTSAMDVRHFSHSGGTWTPLMTNKDTMVADTADHLLILIDTEGNQLRFHDFSSYWTVPSMRGQFHSHVDAGGNRTDASYTNGVLTELTRSGTIGSTTWEESFLYEYFGSANANSGKIKSVTLRRKEYTTSAPGWTEVQRVDYAYYDGTSVGGNQFGNAGDLKTAAISQPADGVSISTLARNTVTGVVTVDTSSAHGLVAGDTVVIRGASNDSFNGTFVVMTATDSDTFQYVSAGSVANATGGTVNKPLELSYYRYYASDGDLKFVVTPRGYARLAANVVNAQTASDAVVADYAENYFEYDWGHRVTREVAQGAGCCGNGAQGEFKYSYDQNYNTEDSEGIQYNRWMQRTTEVLPDDTPWDDSDNDRNLVYLNEVGEVMLKVFQLGEEGVSYAGPRWGAFYKYDDNGRLVLSAGTSAISFPGQLSTLEAHDPLLDNEHTDSDSNYYYLKDAEGLIQETHYGSSTSATTTTAGDVIGYIKEMYVRRGETGTGANRNKQLTRDYIGHTATVQGTSVTVYRLNSRTEYRNDDATGAQTTSYDYHAWHNAAVQELWVTLPVVSESHNGPGSAVTQMTVYDNFGLPSWTKDGGGFITRYVYDLGTGAVEDSYHDVDVSQTSDEPSGWTTPTGGGLHLHTQMSVDGLGRTTWTKTFDSTYGDREAYYVYDDANREVRYYPGWNSTTHTTTGPIQIAREYWPQPNAPWGQRAIYSETLTSSAAPTLDGSNKPTGQETLSASNIQSLSRALTNEGDQVIEFNAYVSLSGVTYASSTFHLGSAGTNYYATLYGYDSRGRQSRTVSPTGTISRVTYDGLGRPTSSWVGTDDTTTPLALYDFGTDTSPVASGYTQIANGVGGWIAGTITDADRGAGTDLTRDLNLTDDGTFEAELANGTYVVTLILGDPGAARAEQGVYFEDRLYDIVSTSSGQTVQRTYIVMVTDGYLTMRLKYQGAGAGYVGIEGMTIGSAWSPATTNGTDLTKIEERLYDRYDGNEHTVGDSNLTRVVRNPGGGSTAQVDELYYDWRNRLVAAKSGVLLDGDVSQPTNEASIDQRSLVYYSYDNLSQVTQTDFYDADAIAMTSGTGTNRSVIDGDGNGVPDAPSASALRARVTDDYDELGRVWQSKVFEVDQTNGTVSTASLKTWRWYDLRGNVIKTLSPGGLAQKFVYDGADRLTKEYITDAGGDVVPGGDDNWDNATHVQGDIVLEQREYQYDANGNQIFATTRQAFHNMPATNRGDLTLSANAPYVRSSYQAFFYDPADRLTDSVDVGTNGGSAYTRPASAPARSATRLVTSYHYNDAGLVDLVTDPRGIVTKTDYDLLGRTTRTTEAFDETINSGQPTSSNNRITEYTYDGSDHVLTMKAVLPDSVFQTTQYIYGVNAGTGSDLASNDLLYQTRYPDKSTGNPSTNTADIEVFAYNALGQTTRFTARNGTVHDYEYDVLGRATADIVSTVGSGVDPAVRRLDFTYDTAGRPLTLTSRSGTASTSNALSQIRREYNGFGQLTTEYQEHSSEVSTGSSPKVQYVYSELGGSLPGDNHSRLTQIIYPNGRTLRYEYATFIDARIGRLSYLADQANNAPSTHIEEYSYLGLGTVVIRNRPAANSQLTYVQQSGDTLSGDAGDQYTGLDRFGRIVDQRWVSRSGSNLTHLDRFQYAYDENSNPLYKNNRVNASFSELYHANGSTGGYDALDRLSDFRRGTLSDDNSDGVLDTVSTLNTLSGSQQSWDLDALGNWDSSTTDGTQTTRDHNLQNEVTQVGSNTLAFDDNGNTTTDDTGQQYVYDAWNRLVTVQDDQDAVIQNYTYDAAGRRISENPGTATDLYYSSQWQVLEERQGGLAKTQYVWSPFYVDELIERDRDVDNTVDGTLDTSFGTGGIVVTNLGSNEEAHGLALQPDGKLLTASYQAGSGLAVLRYNRDGSLDNSFGTNGVAILGSYIGSDILVQPDGKILVAGEGGGSFFVARLNADGSADTSFSSDGMQTIAFYGSDDRSVALALQGDGKVLVAGYTLNDTTGWYEGALCRLSDTGQLDASFGSGGTLTLASEDTDVSFHDVEVDAQGRVLVTVDNATGVLVARYSDTGSLDTTFGTDGIASAPWTNGRSWALAIQPDGKIVAGGFNSANWLLARFTDTGALDTSFSSDGKQTVSLRSNSQLFNLRLAADGTIVGAGLTSGSNGWDMAVARLTPAGELDTSFNGTGKVMTDVSGYEVVYGLVIGPDYRVSVAGRTGSTIFQRDLVIARYTVAAGLEERLYAQTDANHNVTSVADVFADPKMHIVYGPYGQAITLDKNWDTAANSLGWAIGSQGGRQDPVTNTIDRRNRVYNVPLGRFVQVDPIGNPDGYNRYQGLLSSPLAYLDPYGLEACQSSKRELKSQIDAKKAKIISIRNQLNQILARMVPEYDAEHFKLHPEELHDKPELEPQFNEALQFLQQEYRDVYTWLDRLNDEVLALEQAYASEAVLPSQISKPVDGAASTPHQPSDAVCGSTTLVDVADYLFVDNPVAKTEKTLVVGVAYVGGQIGATVGEVATFVFHDAWFGRGTRETMWESVHNGIVPLFKKIWH